MPTTTVELGEFVLITKDELAALVIELPGDGRRMLMALTNEPDYSGPDAISIIAMADDLPTLAARVQAAGLYARDVVTRHGDAGRPIRQTEYYVNVDEPAVAPGRNVNADGTDVFVLDLAPDAVCNLRLSSPAAMLGSIQDMRDRLDGATSASPSAF